MRLGYGAGTGLSKVSAVRDEAIWAEAAGFESFWVSQVFGVDPIVALAAVGAAVPGLAELGTSVVPLTGRHPLALAAEARTTQSAIGGRFTLGIGASHQIVTEGFFGEPYQRAFSRTSEFLAALVPLLNGGSADVDGDLNTAILILSTSSAKLRASRRSDSSSLTTPVSLVFRRCAQSRRSGRPDLSVDGPNQI